MSNLPNLPADAHDPDWVPCPSCGQMFPAEPGEHRCRTCAGDRYDPPVVYRLVLPAVAVPARVSVRFLLRGRRRAGPVSRDQLTLFPTGWGGDRPCR